MAGLMVELRFETAYCLALPCVAVGRWVRASPSTASLLRSQHAVQDSAQPVQGGVEPCYGRPWRVRSYPQVRPGCAMESDLDSRAPAAAVGKSSCGLRRGSAPGNTALACDLLLL